ncbi:MAG: transcription-repair coupling factor [Planctomycetota bacterium]|nr:transcription-repair coupling factor [Planctomycetota bacterium]
MSTITASSWQLLGTVGEPLERLLGGERSVAIGGLYGASTGMLLAAIAERGTPLLVVTADPKTRDALRLDLEAMSGEPAIAVPAWPASDLDTAPDADVLAARAGILLALREARKDGTPPPILVGTLEALSQEVPSPEVLDKAVLRVAVGGEYALPVLQEHLASLGLRRVGAVEAPGEFAGRGGLLDLWPWGRVRPVRIDFFGDEVESIREVDPISQRSGDAIDAVELLTFPPERYRDPQTEGAASFLTAHLPEDARIALLERRDLIHAATTLRSGGDRGIKNRLRRLEKAMERSPTLLLSSTLLGADGDLDLDVGSVDALRGIALRPSEDESTPADRAERIGIAFAHLGARADRIVVYRRAAGEEERLDELFEAHAPQLHVDYREGSLTRSFLLAPTRTAHIAYDDLADLPMHERKPDKRRRRSRPIDNFLELEQGGLVVHLHHGIGLFRGLETIEGPDGEGEYLKLEFAEGTIVYVPVARIDLVQRYIGTGRSPRLSKLGGVEWATRKKKVAKAVEELADDLLETQAKRMKRIGAPLPPDSDWQREFEASFPHEDTPDQATAITAIKGDLEGDQPMDRLLCGDVGYGKTEVALRAIFKVVTNGRQAAVLVPTKILAEQHGRVFRQRLAPYPLRVRVLSSLKGTSTNRDTIEQLKAGTVDVVVGTHRLLSQDVGFKNLGLLIVDEEQRFGVKHKERLKSMRAEVDILSLSATPIPRTLHMALLGIRDISNLTTPPLGRHPIETKVAREDDAIIQAALRREISRGGQVFFVTSRIRELPVLVAKLAELVPEARATYIHGQMEKETVERRMWRFVRGDVDVLLATTIIESGLDIPNANTIVIRDADRYGLAELHQLRGRVGRERRHAYAWILLPRDRTINPEANERLRAIEEYSELGAGFRIAMRDLEIRGAGNLLGSQQSGHIAAVGYDLYCRLLAEAVRRARGLEGPATRLAYLGLELPAGVPEAYVGDAREKFRLFRRTAAVEDQPELARFREELEDRFGPIPPELDRLLFAQAVRIVAGEAGIERLDPGPKGTPGVVLTGDVDALAALTARGLELRPLEGRRAFLPLEGDDVPALLGAFVETLAG